jgi:hypothetical protein
MKGSKVLPQTMSTLGVKHTLPPITTLEPRNRQDRHVGGRDTTYGVVNYPPHNKETVKRAADITLTIDHATAMRGLCRAVVGGSEGDKGGSNGH